MIKYPQVGEILPNTILFNRIFSIFRLTFSGKNPQTPLEQTPGGNLHVFHRPPASVRQNSADREKEAAKHYNARYFINCELSAR